MIVRSTDFPSNPKAAVSRQIGELITGGGRRAVVQDSDWRAMMALARFRQERGADPSFTAWLKRTRPLTSLNSMRTILGLDQRNEPLTMQGMPAPVATVNPSTTAETTTRPSALLLEKPCRRHDQRPAWRAGDDRARRSDAACRFPGRTRQRQDHGGAVRG